MAAGSWRAPLSAEASDLIRKTLRRRHVTQQEFAGALGVSASTVSRLLNGKLYLSFGALEAIARFLELDLGTLLRAQSVLVQLPLPTDSPTGEGPPAQLIQVGPGEARLAGDLGARIEALRRELELLPAQVAAELEQRLPDVPDRAGRSVILTSGLGRTGGTTGPTPTGERTPRRTIRVDDTAMEPWLSAGDIALYDPGAQARPGDPVVAGVPAEGTGAERVLVRYYFPRRRRVELRPLQGESILQPTNVVVIYGVVRERLQRVPGWEIASQRTQDMQEAAAVSGAGTSREEHNDEG